MTRRPATRSSCASDRPAPRSAPKCRASICARSTRAAFAAIHQAWLDHQVLLFRDQVLTDEDLVAFSRRFGELDEAPIQETGQRFVEGHPEIYVVSNVVQDGVAIGSLGAGEAVWHTDMSYLPDPPKASVLYALEVPPSGGDTSFCSMYAAWDTLPDQLRRRVGRGSREARRHLQQRRLHPPGRHADRRPAHVARHACTRWSTSIPRRDDEGCISAGGATPTSKGCRSTSPRRCSTRSGRRRRATRSTWRHQWRVGDLVLWDNRCTMHRRDAFDPAARRVMHRTQIRADSTPTAGG